MIKIWARTQFCNLMQTEDMHAHDVAMAYAVLFAFAVSVVIAAVCPVVAAVLVWLGVM